MHKRTYYIVNGITIYRLAAAPVLILLIILHMTDILKWVLAISFLSDAVDGYLARKYQVTSILGSRLDSIADDLTIAAAITAIVVLKPEFLKRESFTVIVLVVLYVMQTVWALIRYGRISSFHTYMAKIAAVLQGIFILLLFFLDRPVYLIFYVAAIVTALELIEEIILVAILPVWKSDLKGLYWVLKKRSGSNHHIP